MSIWQWVHEFARDASESGDDQRFQIYQLALEASEYGKEDPELNLATLNEGRALASQLNEPWWILFFDHWRLQNLLNYQRDFREVVEIAVTATLEARKPIYAHFPQRICLHEDLITAYLGIDPLGYSNVITEAMDYMKAEVPDDVECRFCAESCRAEFALVCNDLDGAEKSARRTLKMADECETQSTSDHHGAAACGYLCTVSYRRQDWESLREWSDMGEELNRKRDEDLGLATQLIWKAILTRIHGDEDQAKRIRHRAISRVKRARSTPGADYYDALCAFHEQGDELDKALLVRERELARISGKGRLHDECQIHLKRCRILAKLGELSEEALQEAREAANRLRDPKPILAELDQL